MIAHRATETTYTTRKVTGTAKAVLADRPDLLLAMQTVIQKPLNDDEAFLVVINIADTREYDKIIRIFGHKFADDILDVRLASLDFLTSQTRLYNVGFWSIGFILQPSAYESYKMFLDDVVDVHKVILKKLVLKLQEMIICRGIPIAIKSGIGVCDLKKGLGSVQDLLQAAFIAAQACTGTAPGWNVCNYDLAEDNRRAFAIISDVAHSLSEPSEFELCYQPRTELKTGHCVGAEALLRWRHPVLGSIEPSEFIPLVEMTGLIRELTNWVLTHAIWQAVKWQNSGMNLKIAVNVSIKNLDEADFVDRVMQLLTHFGLEPARLELEFSETIPFTDFQVANSTLRAFRDRGVNIAIDDVGTGRNSFGYLQLTQANILKIDQSLIRALKGNEQRQRVVKSLIAMAHDLGISVTGEGVESMDMLELLASWSCDCAQGYYISRPLYAPEFEAWCKSQILLRRGTALDSQLPVL